MEAHQSKVRCSLVVLNDLYSFGFTQHIYTVFHCVLFPFLLLDNYPPNSVSPVSLFYWFWCFHEINLYQIRLYSNFSFFSCFLLWVESISTRICKMVFRYARINTRQPRRIMNVSVSSTLGIPTFSGSNSLKASLMIFLWYSIL